MSKQKNINHRPMVKAVSVENNLITVFRVNKPDEELYSRIRDFLLESHAVYPSIDEWWKTRVVPGLKSGKRLCQVIVKNDEIAALSIVKHSQVSSKLCTLRVRENYRSLGLGQRLLRSTFQNILSYRCKDVHYTISEEVLSHCGEFFTPYGFNLSAWNKGRYVKGKDELIFSVKSRDLLDKLTSINQSMNTRAVLFSIKPEYADLIERGHKRVEFRRKCSANLNSSLIFFYVTSPVREVRCVARIAQTIKSRPSQLWSQFKDEGGIGHKAFCKYFEGATEGTALVLSDVQSLKRPLSLAELRMHQAGFTPPQSYALVTNYDALYELVSQCEYDKYGV